MKKLLVIVLASAATSLAHACYSEGVRIGDLQKFSSRGFINKSWEGEIVLEGFKMRGNQNGSSGGNVWAFSVTDPAVAAQIDSAMAQGDRVALHYCQSNPLDITRGFRQDTPYQVVSVTTHKSTQ